MSAPAQYAQRGPAENKEDCRDYLRTGRCKYGGSCKYNHPANVQSGGGVKAPTDPSEPLFPFRPNEPVCQYYMKHGICKFGQACKFNHPPQSSLATTMMNGQPVLLSMPRSHDSPQVLWNSGGDSGVQLLPQRPDEPNCIFFLKNGRCKYGSTCRYHHPLNFHDRRQGDDGRRQHVQVVSGDNQNSQKVHYVTALPSNAYQHGHFVVSDGAVTFVSLDGSPPAQVISVPQSNNNEGGVTYASQGQNQLGLPLVMSRDIGSSTSSTSIASSYDTSGSSVDPLGPHGDSSSSFWNRPKRSGSGNSLNAYGTVDSNRGHMVQHGNRSVLVQSNSDGNKLPHVASLGSTSDASTVYYDANSGLNRQAGSQHSSSGGNGVSWRGKRSSSFDQSRPAGHYNQGDEIQKSASVPHSLGEEGRSSGSYHRDHRDTPRSPMMRGRPPAGSRSQRRVQQSAEVDDGLSMMTSALLTMLDTPEESAGEVYDDLDYYDPRGSDSQSSTPVMRQQYTSSQGRSSVPQGNAIQYHQGTPYMPTGTPYHYQGQQIDDRVMGMMMPNQHEPPGSQHDHDRYVERASQYSEDHDFENYSQYSDDQYIEKAQDQPVEKREGQSGVDSSWSPTWQGSASRTSRPLQGNARLMQSRTSSDGTHGSSQVGLYLP
jgi:hypothetical protein